MMKINLIKPEKINLLNHPTLNEKWIEEVIANDPSILVLGDLVLKDRQRTQPKAGRLDLLLQDIDSETRYEVEIQLGKTDESHIIRTIEYWDIERKRYPAYEHIAVIVAEDITSRFLNVISLFNNSIPLIAIQMNAYRDGDKHWLTFTKVLSERKPELEEEEELQEATDRNYWEKRGTAATVSMVDQMFKLLAGFASGYELKYNKFYIGLAKNGSPDNFVSFKPRKHNLYVQIKIERSKDIDQMIEKAGLDLFKYDPKWGSYHIRLEKEDIVKNEALLTKLMQLAYGRRHTEE